ACEHARDQRFKRLGLHFGLIALDVDDDACVRELRRGSGYAVGAGGAGGGRHDGFAAECLDGVKHFLGISCDHNPVDRSTGLGPLPDMLDEGLAGSVQQHLAGQAGRGKASGYDAKHATHTARLGARRQAGKRRRTTMLMIAQAIPYLAFAGAALLLGWVAVDLVRARLRKPRAAGPASPDYDRGLADRPVPMSTRLKAQPMRDSLRIQVEDSVLDVPIEAEAEEQAPQADEPAEEQAEEQAEVKEDGQAEAAAEEAESGPVETSETDSERRSPATSAIMYNDAVVRRDPSVRVFDAIVAPSERMSA